ISSAITNTDVISFSSTFDQSGNVTGGMISLNAMSESFFLTDSLDKTRGLKVGQLIRIDIHDTTNSNNQYNSQNKGRIVRINQVYNRLIVVDFLRPQDSFYSENT